MVKMIPDAHLHVDNVEWRPWDKDRTMPFVAEGSQGDAWVKVLSRDAETGAESLLYRLDPGWSAERIRNTVYENLLVLQGEIEVGGSTLRKYAFAYRPEGHELGPISSETGAVVIAYAGAPGELSSKIPVDGLDVESMPWIKREAARSALRDEEVVRTKWQRPPRYYVKLLRGDEENLDLFYLQRAVRGAESKGISSHDAPEEGYFLEGTIRAYDGNTGGRIAGGRGSYIHRPPDSPHGNNTILEDTLVFKHDYFNAEDNVELFYAAYPVETPAVLAMKEGRDPQLERRW